MLVSVVGAVVVIWGIGAAVAAVLPRHSASTDLAADRLSVLATPSASPSPTPTPTISAAPSQAPVPSPDVVSHVASLLSGDDVAAIENAISAQDTAGLGTYLPASVKVMVATGVPTQEGPSAALAAMQPMFTNTDPWDFALDATTLTHYRQGDYGQYFPAGAIVGRSTDGHVLSLIPGGRGITTIFMCLDEILLVTD